MSKTKSRVDVNSFTHTWTIENFNWFKKESNRTVKLESPIITVCNKNDKYQFQLIIDINAQNSCGSSYFQLKSLSKSTNHVHVTLSIMRSNDEAPFKSAESFTVIRETAAFITITVYQQELQQLSNDLTLRCEFSFRNGFSTIQFETESLDAAIAQSKISILDDVEKLLNSDKYSDVTIVVGRKKFPAHKIILSARSAVFSAMFEHGMLENKTNIVKITDIKPEIMAEVLSFIYSSKVKDINKSTSDFFYAAEKYQLKDLMHICEVAFLEKLDLDNLEEILKILDKFETAHRLRDGTLKYLSFNAKAITSWENFDRVMKALSPSFMLEITKALFSNY